MNVWIETDLCNGCQRCLRACPYGAVEMVEDTARILERCTACGACLEACKQEAIKTDATPREIPDFSDHRGVWVFAEQRQGHLARVCLELLGKSRELAETLGEEVSAVLLGHQVAGLAETLTRHGAGKVYLAEHPALRDYATLPYTRVLADLVTAHRPGILLLGATYLGRDLAPRLSRRIGVGLTADCTELTIHPEERILLQTRPAFGGNVMATIASRYSRPQMATVRPGVMEPRQGEPHAAETIRCEVSLDEADRGPRLLEFIGEARQHVDLAQAKVIVAGGRGVGDASGFGALEELADLLGAELAGTRVAVEEGWIPPERQVGQTGQSVRPELYIACGISGAIQHRAGMLNSRYVVAVNKDPQAPIFQIADWGIVGDLHEVVPEMIRQIKAQA